MMSLTISLFTQVSGSGPLGPLVVLTFPTGLVVSWQMLRLMLHCKTKTVELLR